MKLDTNNQAIEVSGGSNTGSFSIAMNGKAFRVLSDTLYQNKIGSVVREVSCNAYDAHVAAGKPDVPFVVHLPDNFEPWFSVQDFGVGLSEDQIKNVFTVYFESTKDNSNDSIGAFGLGAKTPFSYTDQFTVTSNYNGNKSIYSAFIGPSGVPDMQLMHSASTTDGNGVEIKMSVRSQDFSTFEKELQGQLSFFKVKPQILNSRYFKFDDAPYAVFENEHVSIMAANTYGSDISIVQGIVGYKLVAANLAGKISQQAEAVLQPLLQKRRVVHFKFSIGEIGVTASREGVEYSEHTCKSIENKLLAIGKSFSEHLKSSIDDSKTLWEKAVWLKQNNPFGTARSVADLLPKDTAFNVHGEVCFNVINVLKDNSISNYQRLRFTTKNKYMPLLTYITPDNTTAYLVKDKCTFSNLRIKKFFDVNPDINCVYIFNCPDADGEYAPSNFKGKLADALGGYTNVFNLSSIELDKAERDKLVNKRKSSTAEWYKYEQGTVTRQFTYVEDIDEECVYVNFEFGNCTEEALVNRYNLVKSFYNGDLPDLIGVKISQKDVAVNNKNLQHVSEFLKSIKEEDYVHHRRVYRNILTNTHIYSSLSIPSNILQMRDDFHKAAPNSTFVKMLTIRQNISARAVQVSTVNKAAEYFKWSPAAPKRAEKFVASAKKTLDKLPLLREYMQRPGFFSNIKTEDLVQYVKYIPH